MIKFGRILIVTFLLNSLGVYSQRDSVVALQQVILSDVKLTKFSTGYKVSKISDSIIKNNSSLTDLLNFNSLIYFKENGYGMVSSPSFRGTNASQTAVIWNGININSQLNGQTDFNNVSISNFNSINVRSGGGSVQYGSGAVGGSIHLNNSFQFKNHINNELLLTLGSFNTLITSYKFEKGTDNNYVSIGLNYKSSDNNYKYLGTGKENENGSYEFGGLNVNFGYILNDKLILKFYQNSSFNERFLSGTLTAKTNDVYEDTNLKSMITLDVLGAVFSSKINIAHIFEEYKYFANKDDRTDYSFGKVNSLIAKYDASLNLKNDNLLLKTIVEYDRIKGEGADIGNNSRDVLSTVFLLNHSPIKRINYGINVRTEFTDNYKVPFIFSVDSKINLTNFYNLKFNYSKNYRIPTFNDLYWNPGGNLDLKPENSNQLELGNEFEFKSHKLAINGYIIHSKNMIKWLPQNGTIWSPVNINEVTSYGVEFLYNLSKKIGKHTFNFSTNYGFTISENESIQKQLIYVPKNKVNALLSYNYNKFSAFYQMLYNGKVYTTSDNSYSLNSYDVSDVGIAYKILQNKKIESKLTVSVHNVFNEIYQNVAYRPMPNRNIKIKLNINF